MPMLAEGRRWYNSNQFATRHYAEVGDQFHVSAAVSFLPIVQAVGWTPEPSERQRNLARTAIRSQNHPARSKSLHENGIPMNNNYYISEVKQAKPGNFQARRNALSYVGEHWAEKCLDTVLLSEILNKRFWPALYNNQCHPTSQPPPPGSQKNQYNAIFPTFSNSSFN
jgi:hypothetical protein